jgi:hypothetical protein
MLAGNAGNADLAAVVADTLVLYGLEAAVCELDERERGPSGEAAHARAFALRKEAA